MQKRILASAKRLLKLFLHQLNGCQIYFSISQMDVKNTLASVKQMLKTNIGTCKWKFLWSAQLMLKYVDVNV
jgi:hypothetical protein